MAPGALRRERPSGPCGGPALSTTELLLVALGALVAGLTTGVA